MTAQRKTNGQKESPNKRYIVKLTSEERQQLRELIDTGKGTKQKRQRAHILLKADASEQGPNWTDENIAEAFECAVRTVERTRKQLVTEGFEAALNRKKQCRPSRLPKLDGRAEARMIALACGKAPEGRARWTFRLLADKLVELDIVDSVSYTTVWSTLKKTKSNRI